MTNGNDGVEPVIAPSTWAEDQEKQARRARLEGWAYLFLIIVLLAGTIKFWTVTDDIATSDVVQSRAAAKDPPQPEPISFQDVASCGGRTIAIGRRGVIRVSTDDGMSWEDSSGEARRKLNAVAFSDDCTIAVAVGDRGVIRVSTDDGKTWDEPQTHTRNDFNDVALSEDGETAIAVGDRGIFRFSGDRGKTWENLNVTRQHVNGVALSRDGNTAVAVGDNNFIGVFTRKNEVWVPGKNWTDGEDKNAWIESGGSPRDDFEAVALGTDGKSAVVVGDDGAILFSADVTAGNGGWSRKTGKKDRGDFRDVAFSAATVVAVGQSGVIWSSTDGGEIWSFRNSKQGNALEAVALSDDGKVAVAVGRDGIVLVSGDRGENWSSRESRTANRLYGIALGAESKVAMIVGRESTILRSESADGQIFPKMEVVPVAGDARKQQEMPADKTTGARDLVGLLQSNGLRVGITVLFMFMAQHLFGLLRYRFHLAAFLDARRNAVLLASMNMFPMPANAKELERFMDSLSPDTLEIGRPAKTVMARIARMIYRLARSK